MLKNIIYIILKWILPVQKNKILFFGYYGAQYGCSPKYISQYFTKQADNLDIVWATLDKTKITDAKVRKVNYASIKFYYELATAQWIITNYRLPLNFNKRKNQRYIQTWHSSLRLKKIEADAESYLPNNYVEMAKNDSPQIDYLLSGCKESSEIFKRSFWYQGKILEVGTPRIDPLLNIESDEISKIKNELNIDSKIRLVLYAPTFRKNDDYSCYMQDFNILVEQLKTNWGGEWRVMVRLHPHLLNKASDIIKSEQVIDVTAYQDIQELLMISDVVISDYSSLIFDFMFTKKPVVLYVPDLKDYLKNDRPLYYALDQLPFLIANDHQEVIEHIKNFNQEDYKEKVELFLQKIGSFEQGYACEKIYQLIKHEL